MLAANPLISVTPGLMIWTVVCFFIAFFVLKKYAFGPIQKMLDERREMIRRSIEEAENAREEARKLLEEHRALMNQARSEAEQILAEARRTAQAMEQRMRDETEQERLDMTHHIFTLTLGGDICMTKLDHPQSILDVGTGTGIWAIESNCFFQRKINFSKD